jgi:hypothetical protein
LSSLRTEKSSRVVITSTWGRRSLLGTRPEIVRIVVEAGYDTRLVLHPNIWARHGPHQLRLWLGAGHPELTGLVTAVPGQARARLRANCYRLMNLEEPKC